MVYKFFNIFFITVIIPWMRNISMAKDILQAYFHILIFSLEWLLWYKEENVSVVLIFLF